MVAIYIYIYNSNNNNNILLHKKVYTITINIITFERKKKL